MSYRPLPTVLLVGASLGLFSPLSAAQELDPKEVDRVESLGVFGGAAIGAAVGGPPGAVVTAAVGGWISDKILAGRQNRLLKAHVETLNQELAALQENNRNLQARLQSAPRAVQAPTQLEASISPNPPARLAGVTAGTGACCSDSELILHFRTNSSAVESLYRDDLRKFVALVQQVPGAVVELQGHSDRRGENAANLALSQRRVQAVEQTLRELGLRNFAYESTALGERQPASSQDSLETNFFDRRVVLRVRSGNGELLSSSR